ncbi:hypothetical protein DPX16_5295 [Anabarilius grahami]|uniref:Integrase catalytic domain-containing protein n=1 Tax=Anabarilius grahami TaxID=495550 RepID=A0A3N0XU13_ANAGA|nr:hypothetical protein DPX16_5295 [Anabarilius grahami]
MTWHNLVIGKKKIHVHVQVHVDRRFVNKAVIPDKYPLPTAEGLTTYFYGSTVFSKLRQGYLQGGSAVMAHNLTLNGEKCTFAASAIDFVGDYEQCLLSGKTGQPVSPLLQPVPWPSHPWEHLQLDICREKYGHGVPHHQCFLVVMYDLHSKWPKVIPAGTLTTQAITDNGPQFTSADFSTFLCSKIIKQLT